MSTPTGFVRRRPRALALLAGTALATGCLDRLPIGPGDDEDSGAPNSPPTIRFTSVAGVEGAPVELPFAIADSDGDSLTYTWSLGDGTSGITLPPSTHVYRDNGVFEVSASAADARASGSANGAVTIVNVAPTATLVVPATVALGDSFTVALRNPSDPSPADAAAGFTYAFDCGEAGEGVRGGGASARVCHPSEAGERTVIARIRDKDDGTTQYSLVVTVGAPEDPDGGGGNGGTGGDVGGGDDGGDDGGSGDDGSGDDGDGGDGGGDGAADNAAPTARLVTTGPFLEGASFQIALVDASDAAADVTAGFRYAFDCGSGWSAESGASTHVCTRVDDGTVTVQGRIRDQHGAARAYPAQLRVENVAPQIVTLELTDTIVRGENATGSVAFTDPGADSWRVSIAWGDGTVPGEATLGARSYSFSHVYAAAGTFTVAASATDDEGAVGRRTTSIVVITPERAAEDWLIPEILAVCVEAALNQGSCNSLVTKVRTAINHLSTDRDARGVEELQGFRAEVGSLERTGKLTAGQASRLTRIADRLLAAID